MAEWQAMEAAMRVRSVVSSSFGVGSSESAADCSITSASDSLELRALQADRRGFDGKCLRAKGFHLKSVAFQFFGDARKNHHLLGLQLHQHGHQ